MSPKPCQTVLFNVSFTAASQLWSISSQNQRHCIQYQYQFRHQMSQNPTCLALLLAELAYLAMLFILQQTCRSAAE